MLGHKSNNDAYCLEVAGNALIPDVVQMLKASEMSSLCYAYKIRIKPEGRMIEKTSRKVKEKHNYTIDKITDVFGLRLVALFRCDMVDLMERLLTAIYHKEDISPNPFVRNSLEEIIIYQGNVAFDDLATRVQEVASRLCPGINAVAKKSREGYSSIHVVARLDNGSRECKKLTECFVKNYTVPIEIQVRTVFEDAWGEIDHKYGYVIRSGKGLGKPIGNPDSVMSHLRVLKKFSDACMEYAESIREDALGTSLLTYSPGAVKSVGSDRELIEVLANKGVEQDLITEFTEHRNKKDLAEQASENDPQQSEHLYRDAAEGFRELSNKIETGGNVMNLQQGEKLLYYYSKMNQALCLMALNEKDTLIAANHIYRELEEIFVGYPILAMRAGQSYGKLGYLDDAIQKLKSSGRMAQELHSSQASTHYWLDSMPAIDYQ